ncbi:MAG: hypothetical protein HYX51_11535 [Chloroflexi bacterium]|nr:hypothetical protein [Chloroflexota bacterium]
MVSPETRGQAVREAERTGQAALMQRTRQVLTTATARSISRLPAGSPAAGHAPELPIQP